MDGNGGEFLSDVASSVGVEEDKGYGRDFVVAVVAWDENPFEGTASTDTVVVAGDVVVDLGVVYFEDFWEVDVGGVDEHQVACTADGEAVGDGFVGADLAGVGFSLNGEVADCTVETFGCIGKGFDADIDAVGAEVFFNGLRWVEEGIVEEVPDGACTLTLALDECEDIKVEGFNGEFATLLGE